MQCVSISHRGFPFLPPPPLFCSSVSRDRYPARLPPESHNHNRVISCLLRARATAACRWNGIYLSQPIVEGNEIPSRDWINAIASCSPYSFVGAKCLALRSWVTALSVDPSARRGAETRELRRTRASFFRKNEKNPWSKIDPRARRSNNENESEAWDFSDEIETGDIWGNVWCLMFFQSPMEHVRLRENIEHFY